MSIHEHIQEDLKLGKDLRYELRSSVCPTTIHPNSDMQSPLGLHFIRTYPRSSGRRSHLRGYLMSIRIYPRPKRRQLPKGLPRAHKDLPA
ncbi:hypothetical protein V6N13_125357 [Hibiscus sabdariffa]